MQQIVALRVNVQSLVRICCRKLLLLPQSCCSLAPVSGHNIQTAGKSISAAGKQPAVEVMNGVHVRLSSRKVRVNCLNLLCTSFALHHHYHNTWETIKPGLWTGCWTQYTSTHSAEFFQQSFSKYPRIGIIYTSPLLQVTKQQGIQSFLDRGTG